MQRRNVSLLYGKQHNSYKIRDNATFVPYSISVQKGFGVIVSTRNNNFIFELSGSSWTENNAYYFYISSYIQSSSFDSLYQQKIIRYLMTHSSRNKLSFLDPRLNWTLNSLWNLLPISRSDTILGSKIVSLKQNVPLSECQNCVT